MRVSRCAILLLALAGADTVSGVSFRTTVPIHLTRVGAGSNCDTADLQAAIDAAASRAGQDRIEIADDQAYSSVALVIDDADVLFLVGGFANCGDVDGAGQTVLSGAGGAPETVVSHVGSGPLALQRLLIRDGDAQAGAGGASSTGFSPLHGASRLRLVDVSFEDNVGTLAGALYVAGIAGHPRKRIDFFGDLRFERNRGYQGGAISAIHSELLPEMTPRLTVVDNVATQGDGGGLLLINSALLTGFGCPVRVEGNSATRHGGGVSLQARAGSASVFFASRRPCANVFQSNIAGATGGAFHAWADGSENASGFNFTSLSLRLQDSVLRNNRAIDGAAIMLHSSAEGLGRAEASVIVEARVPAPNDDAFACDDAPLEPCSMIESNAARFEFGGVPPPPEGAALTVISDGKGAGDAVMEIRHTSVTGNSGRHSARVEGPNAILYASDSLLADNDTWDGLIEARDQAAVAIARSTLVHADSWNGAAMRADSDFALERSIAIFPGQQPLALRQASNDALLLDVLFDAGEFGFVGFVPNVQSGVATTDAPGFVDADSGNYRLASDSIAIDVWHPMTDEVVSPDLDLAARGIDMPGVGDELSTMFDLGAYEYHHEVFGNGFE